MSVERSAAAKLVRLGAELGAMALEGGDPDPVRIVRDILGIGIDLVGAEQLSAYLSAESAARVDAEVDEEMRAKLSAR